MTTFLDSANFPSDSQSATDELADSLKVLLADDGGDDLFTMLGRYKVVLGENRRQKEWPVIHDKLETLFKCGRCALLDGPMIGVSMSIRDSDYFAETAELFGCNRSVLANIEWMANLWNLSFGNTGLWMGKTFEPVSKAVVAEKCDRDPMQLRSYGDHTTRIGRNFFRPPHDPTLIQLAGLPALTSFWRLKDRPRSTDTPGFDGVLAAKNLEKERSIPYTKTGGLFLSNPGKSVLTEMKGKEVYQLNYRWPNLRPSYPMTRLIDEIVQIGEGLYLGQLVMATKHYSLGEMQLSFLPVDLDIEIGEKYAPSQGAGAFVSRLLLKNHDETDYGYQNNGFFLMIDPTYAKQAYADDAFPQLRPHAGETGYEELGYTKTVGTRAPSVARGSAGSRGRVEDWREGWRRDDVLREKFTQLCTEESTVKGDGDVRELLRDDESVLQMLQRIQTEISEQTREDDHLRHFEALNRLFRSGVAPRVKNGLFEGMGRGYNTRFNGLQDRQWYGQTEPLVGFDYYHGATLNLHGGFGDGPSHDFDSRVNAGEVFPTSVAAFLKTNRKDPNLLNIIWASIGRYIFPWAGKSFERISGRKLSMLVDESHDLAQRYGARVMELKRYAASWPHYDLVKKNADEYWGCEGSYAAHLKGGCWDQGMSDADKEFWNREAGKGWVFGHNIQDRRIEVADSAMRMLDMNYRTPDEPLQELAESGPSPFARMGYVFLGRADQPSIMAMNNGPDRKKQVFQFHYRYPMIGGPVPIGLCLDELVEIAQGLFLGQLIYSTRPWRGFHSSVDPEDYGYRLFGYFLLLDNDWELHRQAIELDTLS